MKPALWTLALLAGCGPSSIKIGDGVDTGIVETDTDTDTDTDSDTDSDTDTDTDTTPPLPDYDIHVDCNGGADATSIQEAIEMATSGDTIALEPCEYHERIDYLGKYLNIYGIEGSSVTKIDADDGGTAVNVETGESDFTRLAGVTVRDGLDAAGGSGLEVSYSAIKLEDVVFEENNESLAVVQIQSGWVDMVDVRVTNNVVLAGGSAIVADGGILTATRLEADCDGGDNALWQHTPTLLLDTTLNCDTGYGLQSYHGEIQVKRSRIEGGIIGIYAYDEEDTPSERVYVYNSVVGGGTTGGHFSYMSVYLANSVFYGTESAVTFYMNSNASWLISDVLVGATCGFSTDVAYTAANNAFWNNTTDACGSTPTGSIDGDPMFVSYPDDVSLRAGSPLINAGYSNSAWEDLDGSRNDIGVDGGPWAE